MSANPHTCAQPEGLPCARCESYRTWADGATSSVGAEQDPSATPESADLNDAQEGT